MPLIQALRLFVAAALFAIAACQARNPLAPPSKSDVPSGLPGSPGTVTDLAVAEVTPNSATLSFTEVDDGFGQPARYVVRFAEPPIDWGSAQNVTEGTCSTPVVGKAVGARLTCTVLGLAPSTKYEFQVVAYRGTLDQDAVFGDLSNIAQGTTSAPIHAPGTVTNLSIAAVTGTSATLAFTEVDNREAQPARYVMRYASPPPIEWSSAANVTEGTCSTPVVGAQVGAQLTCTVLGLAPSTRYEFQVVAYRGTLDQDAVFGDLSNIAQGTTASCDCWTNKAFMPTARYSPGAAGINGLLYVVGGTVACGTIACRWKGSDALEAYDPASDSWTTRAPMPAGQSGPGVAVVNGILYVVGGQTVDAYDPATDTWTTKAPMPTPRSYFGVAAVNGVIYAVGGAVDGTSGLTTLEAYDPATDTWTTKAPMPTGRFRLGVAAVNDLLYAVGGYNAGGLATVEAYDPLTDTWMTKAPMPTAMPSVGAAELDGMLYALDRSGTRPRTTLLAYDPATDTWTAKAPMPTYDTAEMVQFGVAAVAGRLYAVGGNDLQGYFKAYQP